MSIEEAKNQNKEQEQEQEINKDSKMSSKDDSMNKKMQEMYDEHKKEFQSNQRPQSKYHRDRVQSEKSENKIQETKIDEKNLIEKINDFFNKKQITQKEFSDNQNVFLPLDEFFELFKNIKLDLSNEEINYLFNNKNPNKDDGYIYFNTFLENYNFEFYPGESTLINKSNTEQNKNESNNSNYTSLLLNKQDQITPAIQNEFSSFKNDILNIVEQSKKSQTSKKRLPPIKKEGSHRDSKIKISDTLGKGNRKNIYSKIKKEDENSKNEISIRKKPQSAYKTVNDPKTNPNQKKHKVNFLKQTLQRQMLEEEMIKLTIDKRDKEFQRDCVKKMVLANEYAEKLGIPKSYSAYSEEGENTIICRVFSKTIKDYKDINLKQFLIEFKKLEKSINQQNERENYKDNKENKEIISINNKGKEEDFFKMDRNNKHKIIKKILKESIQLKLQLKKQLKALRDKKLIDIDTLNKNLKVTNLDDDTIL